MRVFRGCGLVAAVAALLAAAAPAVAAPNATGDGPAGPRVAKVTILGPIHQNAHVDARDNGQSVSYHGRSLWFFDDTILQNPFGFLSSTAAVTEDHDAGDGLDLTSADVFDPDSTGEPQNFVPYSAAELQFQAEHASDDCTGSSDEYCGTVFGLWPGAAVSDPARNRILVSYGKLCRGAPDGTTCASGFVGHAIGAGFVEVNMATRTITRLDAKNRTESLPSPEGDDPSLFFSMDEDWGGGGMVRDGNTLYAVGKCTIAGCGLAKAPLSEITDLSKWRYYAGDPNRAPQWSTDPADAIVIMGVGGAGGTINKDDNFGGYVHTYMPFLSQEVLYQTAPHPWGPWSTPATLYTAPKTDGTEYAAYAHPEFDSADGLTKYYSYYTSSTGDQILVRVDFAREN